MADKYFPNKDDFMEGFWEHNYRILVTAQGIEFIVNAECEQDALDEVIDFSSDLLPGLVSSYTEFMEEGFTDEQVQDYVCGGNEGLYLTTHNIRIDELTKSEADKIRLDESIDFAIN